MNGFSDAGSTPAVSIGSAAAELGYVYCKSNQHPTTVEFVRCVGCSINKKSPSGLFLLIHMVGKEKPTEVPKKDF